jgi:AraC-like DNA-binding protein
MNKEEFWGNIPKTPICAIANQIPGLYLFAKDLSGRHTLGNKRTLERCKLKNEQELIGKTDQDFYPSDLCAKFAKDDQEVFNTGEALLEISELALNSNGMIDWFITSKFPLFDFEGRICGLIGTTIECDKSYSSYDNYSQIYPAVKHLRENYTQTIEIDTLAKLACLSVRQFQRRFKERFRMSVREYSLQLRIYKACELLSETDLSISEISYKLDFYDNSNFSNQFKKLIKITPKEFRQSRTPSYNKN